MGLLTKVENILSAPMELFHKRQGFHPVDLSRMALRCLEQGCRKGLRQVYAPNTFLIQLHPNDYNELYAFNKVIIQDIVAELERVVQERKYTLAGEIEVSLHESQTIREGVPEIRGVVRCESEPDSILSTVILEQEGDDDGSREDSGPSCYPFEKVKVQENLFNEVKQDVDNPIPEEGRTVLREKEDETDKEENQPCCHLPQCMDEAPEMTTLETNILGVSLRIGNGEIYLENCLEYEKVTVDGQVKPLAKLAEGSVISIGGFELRLTGS